MLLSTGRGWEHDRALHFIPGGAPIPPPKLYPSLVVGLWGWPWCPLVKEAEIGLGKSSLNRSWEFLLYQPLYRVSELPPAGEIPRLRVSMWQWVLAYSWKMKNSFSSCISFFFLHFIYLFSYLLLAMLALHCWEGFSVVVEGGGYSLVTTYWASHCCGFSCCRAQALEPSGFSSCGTWA